MEKKITIKNKISEISKATAAIELLGEEQNLPLKVVFDLTLSLDELLTNIISYAYEDQAEHFIDLEFKLVKNWLCIIIKDDGKEFNPLEQDDPDFDLDLEDMEIGGLGIHLVKIKMDEVFYKRQNNYNILTLKKKIEE